MKAEYFFLFPKIDEKKNGLVFALLKRAKILNEQLSIDPIIVTTDYDRYLAKNYWSLISSQLAPASIGYLNLYGDLQGTHLRLSSPQHHPIQENFFNPGVLKNQFLQLLTNEFTIKTIKIICMKYDIKNTKHYAM